MHLNRRSHWHAAVISACVLVGMAWQGASGVILYSTPDRNTTQPPDALGAAAWNLEGTWGNYLGTPVGSQFFVTANHTGLDASTQFILGGTSYSIDTSFNGVGHINQGDIELWKITGTFSAWAPVYNLPNEVGRTVTIIGRGTPRGDPVYDTATHTLRGWQWGAYDGVKSWGQNVLTGTQTDSTYGPLLRFNFDGTSGLANEGTYSNGDSGGGMFINVGGQWVLAGLACGADNLFSTTGTIGSGFYASIYDKRNLWMGSDTNGWVKQANGPSPTPASAYASQISSAIGFLQTYVPDLKLGLALQPGDTDKDGTIGPADLAQVIINWDPSGKGHTWAQGDFNGDGAIGPADVALLIKNWSPSGYYVPANNVSTQQQTPEPASLALLGIGTLAISVRRSVRK